MSEEEKNKLIKMEKSVEIIQQDISAIKSALLGNPLSGDKGLVGQVTILKAEIELLKDEVNLLREKDIKNNVYVKILTWLGVIVAGSVITFLVNRFLK